MENAHSPKDPKGGTVCLICLKPCQNPATQSCGHNFCQVCSSQSWEEALMEKTNCSVCKDFFLKNKPGSKEPVGKMEGTTRLTTVDKTNKVDQNLCEIHKEDLNLFCVEDQAPLCSVCRKSWDHTEHTVIPRNQDGKKEHQGTGHPFSGWEDGFSNSEPKSLPVMGYTNDSVAFQGNAETLDGNEKDDTEKLMLFEQWVDFNLEEKKEEGTQSNSRAQNSIIWIVLVLFLIQIAGLVTTIFVFTKAKADLPGTAAITSTTPCCPPGWTMNQGNCYQVLELEGAWETGQQHCSSLGASLAVIGNLEKLNDVMNDKDSNHWIGLLRESGERWKWPDGTEFNNPFEIEGDGRCAFLTQGAVSSADCSVKKKWLCSQSVKISQDRCRGT